MSLVEQWNFTHQFDSFGNNIAERRWMGIEWDNWNKTTFNMGKTWTLRDVWGVEPNPYERTESDNWEFIFFLTAFTAIWWIVLALPPGPTNANSIYRLHFVSGVYLTIVGTGVMFYDWPTKYVSPPGIAYMFVDVCNSLLNDFYHRVPSYQSRMGRALEYFHHVLCLYVFYAYDFHWSDMCVSDIKRNPLIEVITAECSTPFLMLWRYTGKSNTWLLLLFATIFFSYRIIYLGGYYFLWTMPLCYYPPSLFLICFFFNALQVGFAVGIISLLLKPSKKKKIENKNA